MCWCPFNLVLADNYVKWIRDRWPGCGLPGSSFPSYFRKRQNKLYFAVFYALWHLIYFQSTRVYHWKIAVCPFPDELWVVMFQISVLVLRRNRILYNCYDCYNLLTRVSTTVKCIIALVFLEYQNGFCLSLTQTHNMNSFQKEFMQCRPHPI